MTLAELIEKLEDIRCQNADNVAVLAGNGSGIPHEIHRVYIEDAIETSTGKKTIAVIIGE